LRSTSPSCRNCLPIDRNSAPKEAKPNFRLARRLEVSGARYSVYAVEKSGKFLRSDFRRFTPAPLQAIHFARNSRAAERAAIMGGKVVKNTIEHPGACRDLGDLIDTAWSVPSLCNSPTLPSEPVERPGSGGMTERYPQSLCCHEAGRAVVAFSLGVRVVAVSVSFTEKDGWKGDTKTEGTDHLLWKDQIALRIAGKAAEEFFDCPEELWASLHDLGEIASLLDRMGMSEEREARMAEGKARPSHSGRAS
jgi:hypothetical protein